MKHTFIIIIWRRKTHSILILTHVEIYFIFVLSFFFFKNIYEEYYPNTTLVGF